MENNTPGINEASKKCGRVKTTLTDRFRVVIWSHFVQQASAIDEAQKFETFLAEKPLGITLTAGLWSRYLRGEVLPQNARTTGESSLIRRIEVAGIAPGAKRIFTHPVWVLMDFERDLSPLDLKTAGLKLNKMLWPKFVLRHAASKGGEVADKFWYRCPKDNNEIINLSRLINLDGLAVSIICARMAYLAQRRVEYLEFLSLACDFLKTYAGMPLFEAKRMKSVLLVMEGGIQAQARAAIRAPRGDYDSTLPGYDIVKTLRQDWEQRTILHVRNLSTSSKAVFKDWLNLSYGEVV